MKIIGMAAAALIAVTAVGAAQAQLPAAACDQIKGLLANTHDKVKALRSGVVKTEKDEVTYTSKVQITGFTGCTIASSVEHDPYWDHHLACKKKMASADAASSYIESVFTCTRDLFSERQVTESFVGGKYRITKIENDATPGGPGTAVSYGSTDYTQLWVQQMVPSHPDVDFDIYFHFLKSN